MSNFWLHILFLLSLLAISNSSSADITDKEWEQQISEKLILESEKSEVVWLTASGEKFLTLFNSHTTDKRKGVVILLHALGGHADWPRVILPLRNQLPEHGWDNLSIQLPVLSPDKKIEDYGKTISRANQRIRKAVEFLQSQNAENIILIGYSFGAVNGLAYLQSTEKSNVNALVTIGMQDYPYIKPVLDLLNLIEKAGLPLLDIYGSEDFIDVIDQSLDRRLAANKGNNHAYTQLQIDGADHYFNNTEELLIKHITTWLEEIVPYSIVNDGYAIDDSASKDIVTGQ